MSWNSYHQPLLNLQIDDAPLRETKQMKAPSEFLDEVMTQFVVSRHQRRLSCDEVNFRIGCADRLVQKWETGIRMPSGFMLWCWARALDKKIVLL